MLLESFLSFGLGFSGGVVGYYAFSWMTRRMLYNLQVDVADLQERHLRAVRKAAAKERWDVDDKLDDKLEALIVPKPALKGWTKWPSSARSESSSET